MLNLHPPILFCHRFLKASEAETETNPIDRTVAHLLFHRPLELTGKIVETPEPNLSAKLLHYDRQASSSISLQINNLPRRLENKQILSHEESEVPCLFRKENQLETSENTLTARAAETGIMKVEPSQ